MTSGIVRGRDVQIEFKIETLSLHPDSTLIRFTYVHYRYLQQQQRLDVSRRVTIWSQFTFNRKNNLISWKVRSAVEFRQILWAIKPVIGSHRGKIYRSTHTSNEYKFALRQIINSSRGRSWRIRFAQTNDAPLQDIKHSSRNFIRNENNNQCRLESE